MSLARAGDNRDFGLFALRFPVMREGLDRRMMTEPHDCGHEQDAPNLSMAAADKPLPRFRAGIPIDGRHFDALCDLAAIERKRNWLRFATASNTDVHPAVLKGWNRPSINWVCSPPCDPEDDHALKTHPRSTEMSHDFFCFFSGKMNEICWTRTRNDHRLVIEPHHAER
jgi:hypothetical protein